MIIKNKGIKVEAIFWGKCILSKVIKSIVLTSDAPQEPEENDKMYGANQNEASNNPKITDKIKINFSFFDFIKKNESKGIWNIRAIDWCDNNKIE